MISQEAIQKILGIKEEVGITAEEMADKLNITFFPYDSTKSSPEVEVFVKKLQKAFKTLKVNVIPYEKSLHTVSFSFILRRLVLVFFNNVSYLIIKILPIKQNLYYVPFSIVFGFIKKRKRIKPGISIIAVGENTTDNLPMDYTASFTRSSVVTILDMPSNITTDTEFHEHFNTAMDLFAYHMTNIVIAVNSEKWILYNFNASHPIYSINNNLEKNLMESLIPKLAAPIRPNKFSEFILSKEPFSVSDVEHRMLVNDLVESGTLLDKAGLYPPGKKIRDLPFRNSKYRWIGELHLDHRSGMSYGFLAWQMPTKLTELIPLQEAKSIYGDKISSNKDYFLDGDGNIFIIIRLSDGEFCLRVPEVWILTQRSGSNKTHITPKKDLLKMGIKNGRMYLQAPTGVTLSSDYKPSFDTKVILAHAVGNAIIASVFLHIDKNSDFSSRIKEKGMALSHWHGYLDPQHIPKGWHVHGVNNPHVACSSPQSAVYAIMGKLNVFVDSITSDKKYMGDIHIEPHHGTNISFTSLNDFGKFLESKPMVAVLGNKYLPLYKK